MDNNSKKHSKSTTVNSTLGKKTIDTSGSPISCVRLDAVKAYSPTPILLQKYININDTWAWCAIREKIDYIYSYINHMMMELNKETDFCEKIKVEVNSGKKLLFKPNIVSPNVIDPITHGEDLAITSSTDWTFVAALMRWFHDKVNISYFQMALGEASTSTFISASVFSKKLGQTFTTEATYEGRNHDLYAGWGFYFVRKYLSDHHPTSHKDDPMNGYEDSINGIYIPPGKATNKLMVYDLNKASENSNRGRTVSVPDGINFKEITLHKVIIGGDPNDKDDLLDYPGCVLINVPKLKMHAQDLLTNAIKNLGIGLYPTQCSSNNTDSSWKYAYPSKGEPNFKGKLPHSPWIFEINEDTHLPIKDANDKYIATKTAGFSGTQADVINAVKHQNVYMLHVVDAINIINISHDPDGRAIRVGEGFIFSSLDCVALDLFCARYCFNMIPMDKSLKLKKENNWPTEFVQVVPVAEVNGSNIVTSENYDSPLFRYDLFRYTESKGIGSQNYHIVGWDGITECSFASLSGHLGIIDNSNFKEIITTTLYNNPATFLHHLQKTVLSYAKSCDSLTNSTLFKELMDTFDEDNDGVISYDEKGRGLETAQFSFMAYLIDVKLNVEFGDLMSKFISSVYYLKYSNKSWNSQKHDFTKERVLVTKVSTAYELSKSDTINEDKFFKGMSYGKGMWPSFDTINYLIPINMLFESTTLNNIKLNSSYGCIFQYADKVSNNGLYTGSTDPSKSDPNSFNKYLQALAKGAKPLDFTIYVPTGYGTLEGKKIPNVEETDNSEKIFTVTYKWFYDAFGIKPTAEKLSHEKRETDMFEFNPQLGYHMPVSFGGINASPNTLGFVNDVTSIKFTIRTDEKQLKKYIPKEFTLLRPEFSINYNQLREVDFLNGGAYNLIQIDVPVRFTGKEDNLEGTLPLVIWENNTQPITGGREESGQPKIFADIQDIHLYKDKYFTNASHQGYTFLELEILNVQPQSTEPIHVNGNVFGYRYIPKVSGIGADLCQCILYPQTYNIKSIWTGQGKFNWIKLGKEKYFYGYHIIEALANLPVYDISTSMSKLSITMKPFAGRILE